MQAVIKQIVALKKKVQDGYLQPKTTVIINKNTLKGSSDDL